MPAQVFHFQRLLCSGGINPVSCACNDVIVAVEPMCIHNSGGKGQTSLLVIPHDSFEFLVKLLYRRSTHVSYVDGTSGDLIRKVVVQYVHIISE